MNPVSPPTARQQITGLLFASPYIIGVTVFLIVPLGLSLYYSFCDFDMIRKPLWIGFDNYTRLFHEALFGKVLINTLIFAAASLPLTLGASLVLALLLNQPIKGQGLYRTIIFLPSLIPAVAGAMVWLILLNAKGLVNAVLRVPLNFIAAHVPMSQDAARAIATFSPPWLTNPRWAMPAIIFMGVWGVGNTVVIFLAGLQDIPRELYEAAELDGAVGYRRLLHVTLPMLSPVIFFNLITGLIGSWQVFVGPYILTGGGPEDSTRFYSMRLFDVAFMELRMGAASAMAWIQFLIIFLLTLMVIYTSKKWVHYR